MELIYEYTKDGLRLPGALFEVSSKNICIIFIHGMRGNILENYFANIWANVFNNENISFLYGHTRGHSHINDTFTTAGYKRYGTVYEVFEDSLIDIELWVNKVKEMGYKKVFLIGHSLGCNKVINFVSKNDGLVEGIVLASPPDIQGLITMAKYQPNYKDMFKEAEENIKSGQDDKLLSSMLWEEYIISSRTFYNYCKEGNDIDNLPIYRNPKHFEQLEKISVPILAFLGSEDDIIIDNPYEDLKTIKNKALSCKDFEIKVFDHANHTYDGQEEVIGKYIIDWIKAKL